MRKPFDVARPAIFSGPRITGLDMHHLQTIQTGAPGQNPPLAAVLPLLQAQNEALLSQSYTPPTAITAAGEQQLLFPATSRSVCDEIGLNWWAAMKLYEAGWLGFAPDATGQLNDAQESELRFVGSLVVAGCDHSMLATLLRGLPRPYAFQANRLYYHWAARQWRALPDPIANPEASFTEWLESLIEKGDLGSLRGILELTQDALSRLAFQTGQQELPSAPLKRNLS